MVIDFPSKTLMIQGTTSHAGKSLLVAAFCRIFSDMGYKVAPFKSQNMSLNSYVNEEGAEIARSQVLQAMAARTKPIAEHNPVLLKPKGNASSQIILMGKPYADYHVKNYYRKFIPKLIPYVKKSLFELQSKNDIVVIEGAGSPAEINLADEEIANMFVAKLANIPVILVADIDRGGVFASIYGTIKLLKPEEQELIKFFIINKFRGDIKILIPGIKQLEDLIGIKCLGVLPYIQDLKLPAEDSLSLEDNEQEGIIEIKVIRLPRISNFTDYEALNWEPGVKVSYINEPNELDNADLIIIPGTKNTIKDLLWLKESGFSSKLYSLKEKGYLIAGICGGYQILGDTIIDKGIEGGINSTYEGLGFLPVQTEFLSYNKITRQVQAEIIGFPDFNGFLIEGYEIHMGKINPKENAIPLLKVIKGSKDVEQSFMGTINEQKNVFGTFIHGFWDNDDFRNNFIKFLYSKKNIEKPTIKKRGLQEIIEENLQNLAKIVKKNINFNELMNLLEL